MKEPRFDCYSSIGCPVEASLELFGGKWKGMILYHLLDGTLRFNELQRQVGNVTQRMLTKQLRELEASGLIHREVYAEVPPKVEYSLTDIGETLRPILMSLKTWGEYYAIPIHLKDRQK
ncbi:helix-turn-helix domain-containing protein [Pseudoalteromonas sp. DL-6]|uniref:winged helix-turn-helix transcriptional regulator n=1 Tax=Pseudoalteromonas sp. DL-6 TaxID=1390185 RepID=UPI001039649A|nr:helix-turn-helix domain-containing protein [Pseudoalteromonas sp. DL-6]QBJ63699.1 transcriptional regulator [Pseudoalteromonas sp. DL-6]